MSQSTETHELQPSTVPPNITNNDDEDGQVWRDVEAETGFSSYVSYLEDVQGTGEHFTSLIHRLKHTPAYFHSPCEIFVLDIHKDGRLVMSLELQYSGDQHFSNTIRKTNTQLLRHLRSPPQDVPARIVFTTIRPSNMTASIIEALGFGLDIDPLFFEALARGPEELIIHDSKQIVISDSIATVARNYRRKGHVPPVLLIVGDSSLRFGPWKGGNVFQSRNDELSSRYEEMVEEIMRREMSGSASLYSSAVGKSPPNDLSSVPSKHYYLKLLSRYVHTDCDIDSEDDILLLTAMLPLLRLELLRLRVLGSMLSEKLCTVQLCADLPHLFDKQWNQKHYSHLDTSRFWLRRHLEGLQESRDTFIMFASHNAASWLQNEKWLSEDAGIGEALAKARTKELEARDYMQLQIGNLSILESRKSIELSTQQMNEAKRGKTVA